MCSEAIQFAISACRQHYIGPPYHVYHCPYLDHLQLATKYTLFGIVAKVNQPAQTITSPTNDTTTSYVYWSDQICNFGLPPTLHWATISCLPLSTSYPSAASNEIYFVWDSMTNETSFHVGTDSVLLWNLGTLVRLLRKDWKDENTRKRLKCVERQMAYKKEAQVRRAADGWFRREIHTEKSFKSACTIPTVESRSPFC